MIKWLTILVYLFLTPFLGIYISHTAIAVSTRHFLLDDAETLAAGELEGTAVNSDGSVTHSVQTHRIELPNVPIAKCLFRSKDGSVFIGTGNKGKIYQLKKDTVKLFAETEELLVSSLTMDDRGILYAGTAPSGCIYSIDKRGSVKKFSEPENTQYIWSLLFDEKRRKLFAATGPEGKVFTIDDKGNAKIYYDSDADHVMTLALDRTGSLYAGTSNQALLLRLIGPSRAEVLYDFPGNEVTAIALLNGEIVVAANDFPKPSSTSSKKKKSTSSSNHDKKSNGYSSSATQPRHPKPGKGQIWRVTEDGRAEKLFQSDKSHFTAVQWSDSGAVYVAAGRDGRIYRIETNGTHAVWIDIDERQVLDIDLKGGDPLFITGDSGAIYRVSSGKAAQAIWNSEVLDAQFHSRFGNLTWRGKGRMEFQTRSGNTEKPDTGWSDWSSKITRPGPIHSRAARFLQIRAHLGAEPDTRLYAVIAYYLPQNQRTIVKDIEVKSSTQKSSAHEKKDKKGKQLHPSPLASPSHIYDITWKSENPDGDKLRFRIKYRQEGQKLWRNMLRETEILTSHTYKWDTSGIPDGYYRIRVDASDELANPPNRTLMTEFESEPVLIDNHPPRISGLKIVGNDLRGKARDDIGPITKLEYAIDGRDWMILFPNDDLFDTSEETFSIGIEEEVKGAHIISVRAFDAASNFSSAEITIP